MLLVLGLALTFIPRHWGKVFGWDTKDAGHLTIMLGRRLEILIALIIIFAILVPVMS